MSDRLKTFELFEAEVLGRINAFQDAHRAQIAGVFLNISEDGIILLIESNGQEYDSELEDALSELDIEMTQDGWATNVSSAPRGTDMEDFADFVRRDLKRGTGE